MWTFNYAGSTYIGNTIKFILYCIPPPATNEPEWTWRILTLLFMEAAINLQSFRWFLHVHTILNITMVPIPIQSTENKRGMPIRTRRVLRISWGIYLCPDIDKPRVRCAFAQQGASIRNFCKLAENRPQSLCMQIGVLAYKPAGGSSAVVSCAPTRKTPRGYIHQSHDFIHVVLSWYISRFKKTLRWYQTSKSILHHNSYGFSGIGLTVLRDKTSIQLKGEWLNIYVGMTLVVISSTHQPWDTSVNDLVRKQGCM